jgi:ribonuclease D
MQRSHHGVLVDAQSKLVTLCQELRVAGAPIAIDTEFISEKRYYAKLCLVQVYCEAPNGSVEALVDPFAVDLAPLLEIIAEPSIIKIVHAGGQDLQIFAQNMGAPAQNVFDTQIAAAFLGYGHQAGLADLVKRVIDGPQLSKKLQFTDWAARPLSQEQMDYALDDVRYLPRMYEKLRNELEARGRLGWATTEFHRAEERANRRLPEEEMYQRLNLSGLSRRGLGVLRELAATRDALARAADKPATFIVPDLTLIQLAKHPPQSPAELRGTRGMPNMPERTVRELMAALHKAAGTPNEDLPVREFNERPDPQHEAVAALLGVIAGARAADHDISRTYLAPREQINALAGWWLKRDDSPPPEIPLLTDWRRELVGEELLQLLAGRLSIFMVQGYGQAAIQTMPLS